MTSFLFHTIPYFLLSALLTWAMMRINIQDEPKARSSHTQTTPRVGGVAIVITMLIWSVFNQDTLGFFFRGVNMVLIGFSLALLVVVNFWDDISHLSFKIKLATQIIVAALAVYAGCEIDQISLPFAKELDLVWFGTAGSFLWIVCMMNLLNFLDGLNGLCSGSVLVASLFLATIGFISGSDAAIAVSGFFIALSLATAGFFTFNFPHGRIFLGDVGSQFLGFLMGILPLVIRDNAGISIFTIPLLFFAPIYDITYTTLFRWRKGEKFWLPHKKFIFHRFHRLGYSHAVVTSAYLFIAILQGIGAIAMTNLPPHYHLWAIVPYVILMFIFSLMIIRAITRRHKHSLFKFKRRT